MVRRTLKNGVAIATIARDESFVPEGGAIFATVAFVFMVFETAALAGSAGVSPRLCSELLFYRR